MSLARSLARFVFGALICGAGFLPSAMASEGLAVVIANEYDGFTPSATRDANAIADKLEADGFDTVRLLGLPGDKIATGLEQVRLAAEDAGPFRIVYVSGFGMCVNDDLMLFTEDVQPEQFKSGKIGDVVVPLSIVREAVANGGSQTLIVFDINPNQCTRDNLSAITPPANSAILITTGIGGDIIEEVDEEGRSAFVTAFLREFAPDRDPIEIIARVIEQIRALTGERQLPFLIGKL